jgi:hypothetical protein
LSEACQSINSEVRHGESVRGADRRPEKSEVAALIYVIHV